MHIVGMAQQHDDIMFQLRGNPVYNWKMYPAEKEDGRAMWPELFPLEELKKIRKGQIDPRTGAVQGGESAYRKEYLLEPPHSVDSFIPEEMYDSVVWKPPPGFKFPT